jgi:ankyrin repeat protein
MNKTTRSRSRSPKGTRLPLLDRTLLAAARRGDIKGTRQALLAGARPKSADDAGSALMRMAKAPGRRRVMVLLIAAGADPNCTNRAGQTPLMEAAGAGDKRRALALLELGADPNFNNAQHETALSYAAVWGHAAIASLLLLHGALPNNPAKPWTPLMYAAREGDHRLVRLLLRFGATARIKDQHGRTAADIAAEAGHFALANTLRAHARDRSQRSVSRPQRR